MSMNNYNQLQMMMNNFQDLKNNIMGNNMVMGANNNKNVQEINNMDMNLMFLNFIERLNMNNISNNINFFNKNKDSFLNNYSPGNGMHSNSFNPNHINIGNQVPDGSLRGKEYMQFKVDDCDIRNIKFRDNSGHNVMISINKNRPLKDLFKEYAKRVGFPEFLLGKEIVFIFNGLRIDVNDDKSTINSLFPKDLITIIVIFIQQVRGANN